jgi:hypothetical protein
MRSISVCCGRSRAQGVVDQIPTVLACSGSMNFHRCGRKDGGVREVRILQAPLYSWYTIGKPSVTWALNERVAVERWKVMKPRQIYQHVVDLLGADDDGIGRQDGESSQGEQTGSERESFYRAVILEC